MKFHGNPSSCKPAVPCGQTDGRTDMARLMVAFRDCFKNAPNEDVKFSSKYVQFLAKNFES